MSTPGQQKAQALIEAGRHMDLVDVKIFTATLIGVMQEKFTPQEFAAAIAEAQAITYSASHRKGHA